MLFFHQLLSLSALFLFGILRLFGGQEERQHHAEQAVPVEQLLRAFLSRRGCALEGERAAPARVERELRAALGAVGVRQLHDVVAQAQRHLRGPAEGVREERQRAPGEGQPAPGGGERGEGGVGVGHPEPRLKGEARQQRGPGRGRCGPHLEPAVGGGGPQLAAPAEDGVDGLPGEGGQPGALDEGHGAPGGGREVGEEQHAAAAARPGERVAEDAEAAGAEQ